MENTPSHLVVYKASAGSGKTFTLAKEYIKLLILNPDDYKHILAVTFTNKATAEMKERILSQLYGIARGLRESDSYLKLICDELHVHPEHVRVQADIALRKLTHDYSNLWVVTIDSFFQSVMRNMAKELDLGARMNISLDTDNALNEAVDTLINNLTPTSPEMLWMLEYMEEKIEADGKWNVMNEIKNFGRKLFEEPYMLRGASTQKKIRENPECVTAYKKEMKALEQDALEQIQKCCDTFFSTLEQYGISPCDLKGGGKEGKEGYAANFFRKLQRGELTDKSKTATIWGKNVAAAAENSEEWTTKTLKKSNPQLFNAIVQAADAPNGLRQQLNEANELRRKVSILINSCQLSAKYLNRMRLLDSIDTSLTRLNKAHNTFLLAATNRLLQSIISDDDSSFIFERIGANIHYLMIDEFQDTSGMQFSNFKILLREGLSNGYDSLIVGDVKQSIYRWRNGDWSLLASLTPQNDTFGEGRILTREMKTNWRSTENIIGFNNLFFDRLITAIEEQQSDTLDDEYIQKIKSAYSDVAQQWSGRESGGYVEATVLLHGDEEKDERMLQALRDRILWLVEEQHIPQNDIAILFRSNKDIALTADTLREEMKVHGISLVSDEAFLLKSSQTVQLLISALHVLCERSDEALSLYRVELTLLYYTLNRLPLHGIPDIIEHPERYPLPNHYDKEHEALRRMPLYDLIEHLYVTLVHCDTHEDEYLFAFLDGVTEYLNEAPSDIELFLRYWDDRMSTQAIPAGQLNGVKLLSIHKSKGLEFPTVIVPFCDWMISLREDIWCTPVQEPWNQFELLSISSGRKMKESIYTHDYQKVYMEQIVDSLNMLYVAFTRAKNHLFILGEKKASKKPGDDKSFTTATDMLLSALDFGEPDADTGDRTCTYGTFTTFPKAEKTEKETNPLSFPGDMLRVPMSSHPANYEFRQSNQSREFVKTDEENADREAYIQQGNLLHHIFSKIEKIDDIPGVLRDLEINGFFSTTVQLQDIRRKLEHILQDPTARRWFDGSWRVYNERSILVKGEAEKHLRMDRVMINDREVIVVDYKFGQRKNKKHAEQVKRYMEKLAALEGLPVSGYLWYLNDNINEIVPVS
jgi:ATP-dependent exoDNAse (exonuclease V) beta subunit